MIVSTPNYYNQRNFKLYIKSFEPISIEEYREEYYDADNNADADLEESYENDMRFWEEDFYSDIYNGGFKDMMEDFNDVLTFHKLEYRSGYYEGVQIYVREKENPNELDNDNCNYYFGMCRSKAIRKYDVEVRKINRWLDVVAFGEGWRELRCIGIFSNGEAIYEYAR